MHEMTATNLRSAYGGESMAHMRYRTWGRHAVEAGFPNVGRLFQAIAYAEEVHANNHFRELGAESGAFPVTSAAGFGLGSVSEHLAGAIEGETFEIEEMYPTYKQTAQFQKEPGAVKSFHYAVSAEQIHARMYTDAKKTVDAGKDIELGPVQICETCGYTVEGEAPEVCPICQRREFRAFP